jgi:hypothetical protein
MKEEENCGHEILISSPRFSPKSFSCAEMLSPSPELFRPAGRKQQMMEPLVTISWRSKDSEFLRDPKSAKSIEQR